MLIVATVFVVSVLLCVPAWYIAQRRNTWNPWDYLTTLATLPIWILLSVFQVGHQSMGNFIEVPVVLVLPGLLLTAKVLLGSRFSKNPEKTSIVTFGILVALIVAVRMLTPEIPE